MNEAHCGYESTNPINFTLLSRFRLWHKPDAEDEQMHFPSGSIQPETFKTCFKPVLTDWGPQLWGEECVALKQT